ncbi:MAG TPA: HAD-IA family hydrolase, partial [Planctomycetota bacterium]|nr:HAD-IA family hydrolase [Planctomycetota bacterium]
GELPAFEAVRRIVGGGSWRRQFEATISRRMARPRPAAWRLARKLRRAGIRTGVLSNSAIEWAWNDLASTPAAREFDPILFSALESLRTGRRLLKPDPEMFRHAAREAGTRPGETALLDDSLENVRAAVAAGLRAIHFVDARSAEAELRGLGVRV